jgi:hypothetical protein
MERIRIRDGKKSDPGSGINIPDHISWSLETFFFGLKILNSLMRIRDGKRWIRDGKKVGSGIHIPDPQHSWCPPLMAMVTMRMPGSGIPDG